MNITDKLITELDISKYRDKLFLFGETYEDLKDKHIIKIIEKGITVAIAMYSKMDEEELSLYLGEEQFKYKNILKECIYLDAISSLNKGKHYADEIINYVNSKFNNIFVYSHIDAVSYWKNKKKWYDIGENLFVEKLA